MNIFIWVSLMRVRMGIKFNYWCVYCGGYVGRVGIRSNNKFGMF